MVAWGLVSDHEAMIAVSEIDVDGEGEIGVSSRAWHSCMADHGIDGALTGVLAGCDVSAEIDCIEGVVSGGLFGAFGGIIIGVWDCEENGKPRL
jgi:hypothetical protein